MNFSSKSSPFEFKKISELSVRGRLKVELVGLLNTCFPDTFEGRTYYKQQPHFRYVVYIEGKIVGNVGLDYRVVRVRDQVVPILGIIDMAVMPEFRNQGIATELLRLIQATANEGNVDFLVAFADVHDVYSDFGFEIISPADTIFLAIDERKSHSLIERSFDDILMVKGVSGQKWPDGKIDMLGYLF